MDDVSQKMVRFRVADVAHPRPLQVVQALYGLLLLEGEVLEDTTDGERAFFLVRVPGLAELVLVPVERTDFLPESEQPTLTK